MNLDSSGVSTLLAKPALPSPLPFKQVEAKPETFARAMMQDLLALSPLTFQPPEPNVSMVLFPMIAYCEKLPLIGKVDAEAAKDFPLEASPFAKLSAPRMLSWGSLAKIVHEPSPDE